MVVVVYYIQLSLLIVLSRRSVWPSDRHSSSTRSLNQPPYYHSVNMRLLWFSALVSPATSMICATVGGGNVPCRSCPATGCEIKVQIPPGGTRDFACVWQLGESVDYVKSVEYLLHTTA